MYSHISGKIVQVAEAIDVGDAISNDVLTLDRVFKDYFGLSSEIYTRYSAFELEGKRLNIEKLETNESDILVFHFWGAEQATIDMVLSQNCLKILKYHNITPHQFFEKGSTIYDLCKQGRNQLKRYINQFHYVLADSAFNLSETIALGTPKEYGFVWPIIINAPERNKPINHVKDQEDAKIWLFVGRIARNKGQLELIKQFCDYQKIYGPNHKLVLVGGYSEEDTYYQSICDFIDDQRLSHQIALTGKISDEERNNWYEQSDVYVSLSEHEGFGVPLIEACHFDIPVIALSNTAVGETLKQSPGLIHIASDAVEMVNNVFSDVNFRSSILQHQQSVKSIYEVETAVKNISTFFSIILPTPNQYQFVSIVICTYNRAQLLHRCLDYLSNQTYSNFEVVVVNGPSTDHTESVLSDYTGRLKIVSNPERNISISRNIGIEASSGDIVAFIDDDAIPHDDWVETLLDAYNSIPIAVAGVGGATFLQNQFIFQAEQLAINTEADVYVNPPQELFKDSNWLRYLLGTNCSFKKSVLLSVDGFDEQYDYYLDETDLCFRIQRRGNLIYYKENAYVRHEFAKGEDRKGAFNYNWYSISKNTTYYIVKANNLTVNKKTRDHIKKTLFAQRICLFQEGYKNKRLSKKELEHYSDQVWKGYNRGLSDAQKPRKTRDLKASSESLKFFIDRGENHRVVKRLHVLILTKEFPPFTEGGGIGTLYHNLAQELLLMGHHVTVVSQSAVEHQIHHCGRLRVHIIPIRYTIPELEDQPILQNILNWTFTAAEEILEISKVRPIDIIDSALWDVEAYSVKTVNPICKIPLLLRLVTPLQIAAKINGWNLGSQQRLLEDMEKSLIRKSTITAPISYSIAETILKNYGLRENNRWKRSYIGIRYWPEFDVQSEYEKIDLLIDTKNLSDDTIKILFLGRLELRKGIDLFINAARRIMDSHKNVVFFVAGDDPRGWKERTLSDLKNDLKKRLYFFGKVDDITKEKLLNWTDVLVFPSRYESFGLVPLEAFVHKTPVIAAKCGAIAEVVEDGKSGVLFNPEEKDGLYHAIVSVIEDDDLRKQLSEGALKRVEELSSRKMAKETLQMYEYAIALSARD